MRVMHDKSKTGDWGFSVHEAKASALFYRFMTVTYVRAHGRVGRRFSCFLHDVSIPLYRHHSSHTCSRAAKNGRPQREGTVYCRCSHRARCLSVTKRGAPVEKQRHASIRLFVGGRELSEGVP